MILDEAASHDAAGWVRHCRRPDKPRSGASGKGLRLRTASIADRLNENVPEKPSLRSRLTRADRLTCDALPGTHPLLMPFPTGLKGA